MNYIPKFIRLTESITGNPLIVAIDDISYLEEKSDRSMLVMKSGKGRWMYVAENAIQVYTKIREELQK